MSNSQMDQKAVNVIKGLIMDSIRKANSGHPGGSMSSADFAYVLYKDFLKFDPSNTDWADRDRFVLAAGHESPLLYGILHLCGFLTIEDLKQFRQLDSITPGHPEHDMTKGVEATSGPLGQGFCVGVGMATAEAFLSANTSKDVVDHYTYVLSSDGDFQEPVALGAATLAGLWGLGKLVVYYDSNGIQLAGPTSRCDCTDFKKVFEGMCWHVLEVDGHDHDAIREAVKAGQAETKKPTLIIGKTVMAKGAATCEGSHNTHGSPLSHEEIAATKKGFGLPENETFYVPEDVVEHFQARFPDLKAQAAKWKEKSDAALAADEKIAAFWAQANTPRNEIKLELPEFEAGQSMATRKAWGACLDAITDSLPTLVGGSADLDPSNQTANFRKKVGDFALDGYTARNLAFGVREFPMSVILNGMALHGGVIPFGATFLTFSDYCRNGMRMSALQHLPVIYIYTHDSFYVGEDGPTHQPIEHVASLRLIPNMLILRPADARETAACLNIAMAQTNRPSSLMLTRQGLPVLGKDEYPQVEEGVKRGGYIVKDCDGTPDMIAIAAGSEVSMAIEAASMIKDKKIRVVSMPSMELFEEQDQAYKDSVIDPKVRTRVAAEAGRPEIWYKYVGLDGEVLGINHFGASAPAGQLAERYGFTAANFAEIMKRQF
ncbi:transketolase [Maridesulfovibrio hydrothermalis]|uniref:Transketolase n=1 Tax=Maridesulfovibrio hydrothermalis AM13 = DSM 14728 TaxID=1121451 RepID=L0RC83_9BACT|nr:transketolase [Maridesulfovibrio hydrothermalis]CCO23171.1 Transketolase 2 [Maridesulfovibrio hydrothermalis AM13 = DSM 14728]